MGGVMISVVPGRSPTLFPAPAFLPDATGKPLGTGFARSPDPACGWCCYVDPRALQRVRASTAQVERDFPDTRRRADQPRPLPALPADEKFGPLGPLLPCPLPGTFNAVWLPALGCDLAEA